MSDNANMSDNSNISDDSEGEIVSKHHSKLLKAVEKLDKGQRVKKAERSEPTLQVSEFHLVKSAITDKDAIHPQDLVKSLGQKGYQSNITKRFRYLQQKTKVLPKPLEKPTAERIKRTVGFENTKKDLQKWNAIIAKNRTADHLSFPLKHIGKIKESPTAEFLKRFRVKSDLMTKLEEIDKENGIQTEEKEEENPEEKFKVTMKELILKRKEAAKQRAQQSYKEAKASRQRKIKSKKFHRIQRKQIVKQQIKQFKELETTDAQAALEKLNQLDKVRAEERMTLRHRNTGHWAKNKQIRAKYNKDVRQELAEQLAISKELTQKVRRNDSESENEDKEDELPSNPNKDNDNPWTKTESDVENFIKSYRQYWTEKHKKEAEQQSEIKQQSRSDEKDNVDTDNVDTNDVDTNDVDTENVDNTANKKPTKSKRKRQQNTNEDVVDAGQNSQSSSKKGNNVDTENVDNTANKKPTKSKRKCQQNTSEDVVDAEQNSQSSSKKESEKKKKVKKIKETVTKSKRESNSSVVKNKTKKRKKPEKDEEEEEDYFPDLEFTNTKRKVTFDEPLEETTGKDSAQNYRSRTNVKITKDLKEELTKRTKKEAEIDPNKYLNIKPKYLHTQLPDIATGEEEENSEPDDDEERRKIMSEAFADDDVIEEFRKEKEEAENKNAPQELDLKLPGWGSWGGPAVEENKKKRKRNRNRRKSKMIIMNVPKQAPRKEENKGNLIIFEHENKKLKKHLVDELPHPFTKVADFEASLRAPISRTFVAENAYLQLIKPSVTTKIGHVIKPMDENVLVKKPIMKKRKRNLAAPEKKNDKKSAAENTKRRKVKKSVPKD
ncbi:U3 small nucleolar RNA-associated protein 14 homolog A isoform X2 [Pseudomyrmex gracilis]|nr:U3 small nucleolar RNA-associated protein 14 homolog A isoform X2 [Pseudomyrmex gracilis]